MDKSTMARQRFRKPTSQPYQGADRVGRAAVEMNLFRRGCEQWQCMTGDRNDNSPNSDLLPTTAFQHS